MARFYSTFNNSTLSWLQAASNGYRFQRVAMTDGTALKSAWDAARAALSTAVYGQLTNPRGDTGLTIAQDQYTRGGGLFEWPFAYTSTKAIYNPDARVRPQTPVLSTDGDASLVADDGSISDTLYVNAQTALENVLTHVGFRSRTVISNYNRLWSLFHGVDGGIDYIGWDDFTPGQPSSVSVDAVGYNPIYPDAVPVTGRWVLLYPSDVEYEARVRLTATQVVMGSGPGEVTYDSGIITRPAGDLAHTFSVTGLQGEFAEYTLNFSCVIRITSPVTGDSASRAINMNNHIVFGSNT